MFVLFMQKEAINKMEQKNTILEVKKLNKVYKIKSKSFFSATLKEIQAVDNISFSIKAGETLGIIGESGSGKTTLMRLIIGLETLTSGEITFKGRDITRKRDRKLTNDIQMIFQDSYASLDPRMSIKRILEEPFRIHFKGLFKKEKNIRIKKLLNDVGMPENCLEKYPHELSGGQRQRINIARALVTKPSLIVCDEPTSSLDVSIQAQILNLFKELQREYNLTYLFISHDMSVVRFISHQVMVMKDGEMVEFGHKKEVIEHPKNPYTQLLMQAVPLANPRLAREKRKGMTLGLSKGSYT